MIFSIIYDKMREYRDSVFLDLFSNRIYLLYQEFVAPSVLFIATLSSAPSLGISPSPTLERDDRIYFEIHRDF